MCKAPVPPTSNSQWYWTDNRARATLGQPSHPTRHTLSLHTATYARTKPAEAHAQLDEKVLVDMKSQADSKNIARYALHTTVEKHCRKEVTKQSGLRASQGRAGGRKGRESTPGMVPSVPRVLMRT